MSELDEDDDLADLLSESDMNGIPTDLDDLNFISYDEKPCDATNNRLNDDSEDHFDPFAVDDDASSNSDNDEHEHAQMEQFINSGDGNDCTPMDEDGDASQEHNSDDDDGHEAESGSEQEEDKDAIDWEAVHAWPSNNDEQFASRVILMQNIPISLNESMIREKLFHDIPAMYHPIDVRLFHHRHYLSGKPKPTQEDPLQASTTLLHNPQQQSSTRGYAQLIFAHGSQIDAIMPLLRQKEHYEKYRLVRPNASLKDIVTDHCVHRNLKDATLRLVFVNLHWRCKALHVHQFVQTSLTAYVQQQQQQEDMKAETDEIRVPECLPIKIQIIENEKGYSTGCAVVDFEHATTASLVLFACHQRRLLDRPVYVDWHPFPSRIKTWMKQQRQLTQQRSCRSLLIHNIQHTLSAADIESFVRKHLCKVKNGAHSVVLQDVHLMHNRKNELLCGYGLVTFSATKEQEQDAVFEILLQLMRRIQYKVLQHRSIFVMLIKPPNSYCYQLDCVSEKKTALRDQTRFVMLHNLAWDVTETALRAVLSQCSSAKPDAGHAYAPALDATESLYHSLHIIVDGNGYPLCKALVKCMSPQIATKMVLELDGQICRDRAVVVDWCDEKSYKSMQSMHHKYYLDTMEFASQFSATQMVFFRDQLFGDTTFGNKAELKQRKRSRSGKNKNTTQLSASAAAVAGAMYSGELDAFSRQNEDIIGDHKANVLKRRQQRKSIFLNAKRSMVDERMLKQLKSGKTLQQSRPKTFGQIREQERKGKTGMWTKLGMSKHEMLRMGERVDWGTGESVLSRFIAAKKTIHVKNRWDDSIKYARRRTKNRLYIQKDKHAKFRKDKKRK